jgi:hypothetical protein
MDISHGPSLAGDPDQATTEPGNARLPNRGGVCRQRVLPASRKFGRLALVREGQFNFLPVNYLVGEQSVVDLRSSGRSVRQCANGAHWPVV